MAYEYRIDSSLGRVHVTAHGPSTFEEGCAAAEDLVADPAFVPTMAILCDARRLEYLASYQEALGYRDLFDRLRASFRGPIAIVVEGAARYGMTRMVASLAQLAGVDIEAFRTVEDAELWLLERARRIPG